MASYKVIIQDSAKQEFAQIPFPFRRQLNQAIYKLKENPRPADVKAVKDDLLVLTLYGWSILYRVDDASLAITILRFYRSS